MHFVNLEGARVLVNSELVCVAVKMRTCIVLGKGFCLTYLVFYFVDAFMLHSSSK